MNAPVAPMEARHSVTPLEALKRLIAVAKTADAMGFEELGGWNQFQTELAVAEMVVRDYVAPVAQPAQQVEAVEYGCHIDLPEGHHDNCVLDGGNRDDCTYARRYGEEGRKKCGEWKPIKVVEARQAGDVALRNAVANLIKAKGRFHTERCYVELFAAYDALMAKEKA